MKLEFYNRSSGGLIVSCDSECVPDVGDKVNILRKTWVIVTRSWAVDNADKVFDEKLRACLNCAPTDDKL